MRYSGVLLYLICTTFYLTSMTHPRFFHRLAIQFELEVLLHDSIVGMSSGCVMTLVDDDQGEMSHVHLEITIAQDVDQDL